MAPGIGPGKRSGFFFLQKYKCYQKLQRLWQYRVDKESFPLGKSLQTSRRRWYLDSEGRARFHEGRQKQVMSTRDNTVLLWKVQWQGSSESSGWQLWRETQTGVSWDRSQENRWAARCRGDVWQQPGLGWGRKPERRGQSSGGRISDMGVLRQRRLMWHPGYQCPKKCKSLKGSIVQWNPAHIPPAYCQHLWVSS